MKFAIKVTRTKRLCIPLELLVIGERDTIRGVQIRADAVRIYIYMYGGTCAIIIAHITCT